MLVTPTLRSCVPVLAGALGSALIACAGACSKRGPREVGGRGPDSVGGSGVDVRDGSTLDGTDRVIATPAAVGRRPRELARSNSRVIATDDARVYFGDTDDDTLCSIEKMPAEGAKNEPMRIARRAPVAGTLAVDVHDSALVWIASPGDAVLRVPVRGGTPTTIRERGIFTDVAAADGDVFVTEARDGGGTLTRVTGTTAAQLASFEGTPRGVVVDADRVYVATPSRLLSTPRTRGEVSELARGAAFASPQLGGDWLYATAASPAGRGRIVVRVKKTGGPLETVAPNVRDAPIALHHGTLYWFHADRPALLSSFVGGDAGANGPRVVSEDPVLDRPSALTVDDDGAFVATGHGESARIVAISLR